MLLNIFKSAKYTKWKSYNNVIHYPKYAQTPRSKVSGLKTPKSKLTNITKFVDSFKGFVEVSPNNFTYLVTQTENLKKQIGVI